MKEIKTDKMPREVATEMLCAPGARITNRMRKNFQHARQKEFASELVRKPVGEKIRSRAGSFNRLAVPRAGAQPEEAARRATAV